MANKIRCGVIGYGGAFNMGRAHANYITATKGLELTAICDADAARTKVAAEDFPGVATYNAVDDFLQDPNVDLAVIVLPHNLHAPVSIQCSHAKKHVIVEKPMCITVDEATKMIKAARKADRMLSVFHNRRQDADYRALREIVVEKKLLGEVFEVEMWGGGFGRPNPNWWRSSKEISGGHFYDWGAHYLDWLLGIVPGAIDSVTGYFHKRIWHEVTNEDHVQAIIKFSSGCVANVQMSSIAYAGKPRWWVLGEKGAAVDKGGHFEVTGDFKSSGYPATLHVPYKSDSEWKTYYTNISDHLVRGKELKVKPEQARRVIAIMETAEKSSEKGRSLNLPTETEDAQFERTD
ncbi:MAG: Gfo/Idh/MocA family oxidoreductase [Abitibacteriaceae bacterium]|nr:Gfo/Idh/MocA family oxidoreductase [Abditibacteriaceae bacterium]